MLKLFSVIISKLNIHIQNHVPGILKSIFDSTLHLIQKDFNSHIDIRINFFEFLKATISHCFGALIKIDQ